MRRDWAKLFGKQLAKIRKAKGKKQHELEEAIGKEAQYLSHLETGRSTPGFESIFLLAQALDVSAMDFFFLEGVDDRRDVLRRRILDLLDRCDEKQLRKVYRLILVSLE